MKANPGGNLNPEEVVGRDELIADLWEVVRRQSVTLVAERRMGKTSVTRKMFADPPSWVLPVWQDLEGCRHPLEFVEQVFHQVDQYLGTREKMAHRVRKLLAELGETEVVSVKFPKIAVAHWKTLLMKTMEDLAEHQERVVLFFWDELPLMLKNVKEQHGEALATELLDALRAIRQTHDRIRMFFTGSIGLHNVITSLQRSGYSNAPINDTHVFELPPLSPDDGSFLAESLLHGEAIAFAKGDPLPMAIADSVDCIPYYIHLVVDQMKRCKTPPTSQAVRELVTNCLTDGYDAWKLRHYRTRIDIYYDKADRPLVLAILDVLAAADGPLLFTGLLNLVKAQIAISDAEELRRLLSLLRSDHYVTLEQDGRFSFRFPFIRRWWRLERGLQI